MSCDILSSRTYPIRLPKRPARINGDTRRRKRRIREKMAKLDLVRFTPEMFACIEEIKRRVIEPLDRKMCRWYD